MGGGSISYRGKSLGYYNMFSLEGDRNDVRFNLTFQSLETLTEFFGLANGSFEGMEVDDIPYSDEKFRTEILSKVRIIFPSYEMRAEEMAPKALEAMKRVLEKR